MWSRREFLCRGTGTLMTLGSGAYAYRAMCQDEARTGRNARGMITPATERAVASGLRYLGQNQRQNGSFGTSRYVGDVAVTSLAGLAFMASGSQPNRGPYGRHITSAIEYVINQEMPNYRGRRTPGFLCSRGRIPHGPMYGHGFGTLFLAEAYGMVHERNLRDRLRGVLGRAVQLILDAQNRQGGWRYHPFPNDADLSVTICQIMALRAARNAGFSVPRNKVDDCIRYVKNCQDVRFDGGFRYMQHGGPTGFARTAAGVVALYSSGVYRGEEVTKGLEYLRRYCHPGAAGNGRGGFNRELELHFYYGHYYAVQAMWTAGGRYWREWFPAIREELLRRQQNDGSWHDNRICRHYCTAMACIIMQIPNNYLPIFQR